MTRRTQSKHLRKENLEQKIVLDATAEFVFDFATDVGVQDSVIVGDVVYFPADDGTGDVELWKSDGSIDGTTRVKDIRVGRKPSIPKQLTTANGSVYFTAYDDQHGREAWVSDGTEAGTLRLTDTDSDLRFEALTEAGDLIYFAVWRFDIGQTQIWQSDGTAAGTTIVTTVESQVSQIYPVDQPSSELGGLLLGGESGLWFVNLDETSSTQLFASGRVRVTAIFELGDELYIRVQERWIRHVDLDTMTTEQVFDSKASRLVGPLEFQGDVIYALHYVPTAPPAATARGGTLQVFRSESITDEGMEILNVDSGVNSVDNFHSIGDKLLFGIQQNNARQLWTSDGTADGTEQYFASFDTSFGEATTIGSDVYIEASDFQEDDFRIWRINGSDLTRTEVVVARNTSFVGALGDRLLFRDGLRLMTTDGTQLDTTPLAEELPLLSSQSGLPFDERDVLTTVGDGLLIKTGYPTFLYRTDGAASGIERVETTGMVFSNINTAGDLAFFLDDGTDGSSNLWAANVVTGELQRIQPPNVSEWDVGQLPVAGPTKGSVVYFQAESYTEENGNLATHIWVSDGTNEGTRPVLELASTVSGRGRNMFLWNDSVLFHTEDEDLKLFDGSEVRTLLNDVPQWRFQFYPGDSFFYFAYDGEFIASDGTVEGTSRIGSGATHERSGEVFGDRLHFIGDDGLIWLSDGTPESTRPVVEDAEFIASSLVGRLGDDLYFFSDLDNTLWKTDGTPSGTTKVADIWVDTYIHSRAVAANGRLYFNAQSYDGPQFNGAELWRTDGTSEGTVQVTDIAPGSAAGSNPKYLTKVNGFLYFAASDGFRGGELWRYPIDPVPGDADGNGTVNFVDFLQLSANYGLEEEALHSEGDFNFDGAIDFEDFLLLSANYGKHYSNEEPTS